SAQLYSDQITFQLLAPHVPELAHMDLILMDDLESIQVDESTRARLEQAVPHVGSRYYVPTVFLHADWLPNIRCLIPDTNLSTIYPPTLFHTEHHTKWNNKMFGLIHLDCTRH